MENQKNTTNLKKQYVCVKCGSNEYTDQYISTTSGILTKVFDIQSKKFLALSCNNCGFTEFYKTSTPGFENVIDFLTK